MVFDYGNQVYSTLLYILYHPFIIRSIYYVATFTTVSIVSKRLITTAIIMLPLCSSSLVSSSHSYDETVTNRHPATSSLCYFACQKRPFMLEEMLAYEVKPYS